MADALIHLYGSEPWRVARSIAELSRLCGRHAAAAQFQRIADLDGPDEDVRALAQRILNTELEDLDSWEASRAGEQLAEACPRLEGRVPFTESLSYAERVRDLGRRAGNGPLQVIGSLYLGGDEAARGELERAMSHAEAALHIARATGDRRGETNALALMSDIHRNTGDLEASEQASRRALAVARTNGDEIGQARAHARVGSTLSEKDDLESARVEFDKALELGRPSLALWEVRHILIDSAQLDIQMQDRHAAARQPQEAIAIGHHIGPPPPWSACAMGTIAMTVGDWDEGSPPARRSGAEAATLGDPQVSDDIERALRVLELGGPRAAARLEHDVRAVIGDAPVRNESRDEQVTRGAQARAPWSSARCKRGSSGYRAGVSHG